MSHILRTLSFGLLAGIGLGASAQGHTIFVHGHANPCNPAMAGSTVNILVQGNISGGVSATATLNENCYYYAELLVHDAAGWVNVTGSCGNGASAMDTTYYSLTPPFTTDVLVNLNCGVQPPACNACITMAQNSLFTATFSSCSSGGSGAYTYLWDFSGPGGGAVPGDHISHTFPVAGQYAVCLNVTDAAGTICNTCETVYVDAQGNVSLDPPTTCQASFIVEQNVPWSVTATSTSTGSEPLTYHAWFEGSAGYQVTVPFNQSGIHIICLTVGDGSGCHSTFCDSIALDANGILVNTPWYDCLGVEWGSNTVGTACTTPNGATGVWNAGCECITNTPVYDCLQILNGPNMPGTPCQIPGTILTGTWSANCTCEPASTGDCDASFWIMQAYQNGDTTGTGVPIPNTLWVWNLSNGGTGLYQFLWNFGDGTSSTEAFPTHVYADSGPYILCLTIADSQGCTDTYCDSLYVDDDGLYNGVIGEGGYRSTLTVNVVNPLTMGIGDHNALNALSIWPNPAREQLNIAMDSRTSGTVHIEVIDLNGRNVLARQERIGTGNNRIQLSTEALPAGMYALRITNGSGTITQRFVRD